ncbi:MAG: four helix bundle protein [Planctomycetota bacterium]
MMFDHEKLDVYRVSIEFVTWSYRICRGLKGVDRHARDQLLRASQSIPLNIADGNGKLPSADRQRYLRTALGSALECAATLDVLLGCNAVEMEDAQVGKGLLVRIVAMLTKMTSRSMGVREEPEQEYDNQGNHEAEVGGDVG